MNLKCDADLPKMRSERHLYVGGKTIVNIMILADCIAEAVYLNCTYLRM